jgi:protein-S-isoprenylcysteine O-methyltransferase Ste14
MLNTISLLLRNLLFTVLHPGLVVGVIPYLILGNKTVGLFAKPLQTHQYLGMLLFIMGFIVLIACITRFIVEGRGTLSPIDPTKRLVVKGLYKYSRNPMYAGVMMMLISEAVFFQSGNLWIYLVLIFLIFHLFIALVEEPRLLSDFGEEYYQYCQKVRRWI